MIARNGRADHGEQRRQLALALTTVWTAIAASYQTNWPIGFFIGVGSATWYLIARATAALLRL